MLTYQCKKCGYSFSQADKAWDHAVTSRVCSKCNHSLDGFYVASEDAAVIKNFEDHNNRKLRLVETEQLKLFTFILCSFLFLLMLFSGQLMELATEPKGFKIILLGIVGIIYGFNAFRRLFNNQDNSRE